MSGIWVNVYLIFAERRIWPWRFRGHRETSMKDVLITISREFGSGGRGIGELIGKNLGIPVFDKTLVDLAAEKSGYTPAFIINNEQKLTHSFLFDIAINGVYPQSFYSPHSSDVSWTPFDVYSIQSKVIQELASKNPSAVFVGRCANFILREEKKLFSVFITADMDSRIKRAVSEYGLDSGRAEAELRKRDKERRKYYDFYTAQEWGEARNYHLTIDSSKFGVERSAEIICDIVKGL